MSVYVSPHVVRHNLRLPARDNTTPGSRLASMFGRPCPYCEDPMWGEGSGFPTKDHVKPKSRGGGNSPKNILIVCRACNGDKGNMSLVEFYHALALAGDRRAEIVRVYSHGGTKLERGATWVLSSVQSLHEIFDFGLLDSMQLDKEAAYVLTQVNMAFQDPAVALVKLYELGKDEA